nr:immunoglobulin heavy chain junction region [Mus musculus]MBK4189716.1 immunoglobulin heavy chain junction region [Mus musculus]MBK4189717.1 immunoglobulin heavy chain junction region [Mus musculus]
CARDESTSFDYW